jgi:hypothetical protein
MPGQIPPLPSPKKPKKKKGDKDGPKPLIKKEGKKDVKRKSKGN